MWEIVTVKKSKAAEEGGISEERVVAIKRDETEGMRESERQKPSGWRPANFGHLLSARVSSLAGIMHTKICATRF